MTTTPEYDAILARKMKEREIKGNISSVKMSPEETAKEIADITEGSFTAKGGEVFDYSIAPDGNTVTIKGTDRGAKYLTDGPHELPEAIRPKKKRGRPLGSKNKKK